MMDNRVRAIKQGLKESGLSTSVAVMTHELQCQVCIQFLWTIQVHVYTSVNYWEMIVQSEKFYFVYTYI